jgi:hypothetical protein
MPGKDQSPSTQRINPIQVVFTVAGRVIKVLSKHHYFNVLYFILLFLFLLFIYSHVYTLFGSFLPPPPPPSSYFTISTATTILLFPEIRVLVTLVRNI